MCTKHGDEFMTCINGDYFCTKCFDEKDYEDYLKEQKEKENKNANIN